MYRNNRISAVLDKEEVKEFKKKGTLCLGSVKDMTPSWLNVIGNAAEALAAVKVTRGGQVWLIKREVYLRARRLKELRHDR